MDVPPFCSNAHAVFQSHRIASLFIVILILFVAETRSPAFSVLTGVLAAVELFQPLLVKFETCSLCLMHHPYQGHMAELHLFVVTQLEPPADISMASRKPDLLDILPPVTPLLAQVLRLRAGPLMLIW